MNKDTTEFIFSFKHGSPPRIKFDFVNVATFEVINIL